MYSAHTHVHMQGPCQPKWIVCHAFRVHRGVQKGSWVLQQAIQIPVYCTWDWVINLGYKR